MLKNIKWSNLFVAICYVAVGVLLVIYPQTSDTTICNIMGFSTGLIGIVYVIRYFASPVEVSYYRSDFLFGLLLMVVGLMVVLMKEVFIPVIYILLALIVLISGLRKLEDFVDATRMGASLGLVYFLMAIISIGFAALIILDPFKTMTVLHRVIGCGIVYSGISDILSIIFLSVKLKAYFNRREDALKVYDENLKEQRNRQAEEELIEAETIETVESEETVSGSDDQA